ncbi:MAG: hypothetical protein DGJ47_000152 [Rickettsiaceae bacterium]
MTILDIFLNKKNQSSEQKHPTISISDADKDNEVGQHNGLKNIDNSKMLLVQNKHSHHDSRQVASSSYKHHHHDSEHSSHRRKSSPEVHTKKEKAKDHTPRRKSTTDSDDEILNKYKYTKLEINPEFLEDDREVQYRNHKHHHHKKHKHDSVDVNKLGTNLHHHHKKHKYDSVDVNKLGANLHHHHKNGSINSLSCEQSNYDHNTFDASKSHSSHHKNVKNIWVINEHSSNHPSPHTQRKKHDSMKLTLDILRDINSGVGPFSEMLQMQAGIQDDTSSDSFLD